MTLSPVARSQPQGDVIASGISYDLFLQQYDGEHVEWVEGRVIRMASVTARHDNLSLFFTTLLELYLSISGGGFIFRDPMILRLPTSGRAPDVQVLLPARQSQIRDREILAPVDLIIEIVSPTSIRRDYFEKFGEYEAAGIPEYWIIDPDREQAVFYILDEHGFYTARLPIGGVYYSAMLPQLALPLDLLWQPELPRGMAIVQMVQAMFSAGDTPAP